jgi:hypothetical protein
MLQSVSCMYSLCPFSHHSLVLGYPSLEWAGPTDAPRRLRNGHKLRSIIYIIAQQPDD